MARDHDPETHRRVTVLLEREIVERIESTRMRLGILRERFMRDAVESHLRASEQSNG